MLSTLLLSGAQYLRLRVVILCVSGKDLIDSRDFHFFLCGFRSLLVTWLIAEVSPFCNLSRPTNFLQLQWQIKGLQERNHCIHCRQNFHQHPLSPSANACSSLLPSSTAFRETTLPEQNSYTITRGLFTFFFKPTCQRRAGVNYKKILAFLFVVLLHSVAPEQKP